MEFAFELIFQIVGEFLFQLPFEILAEWGSHNLAEKRRKPRHPLVSFVGHLLLGGLCGALSLLILPHSPIGNPDLRLAALFLVPLLLGILMVAIGKLRQRRGQELIRLDRFAYAFAFAFAMGLVRFIWAA